MNPEIDQGFGLSNTLGLAGFSSGEAYKVGQLRGTALDPFHALYLATLGGARALRRDDIGRLGPGARADLLILDAPRAAHLAYRPGSSLVAETLRAAR